MFNFLPRSCQADPGSIYFISGICRRCFSGADQPVVGCFQGAGLDLSGRPGSGSIFSINRDLAVKRPKAG